MISFIFFQEDCFPRQQKKNEKINRKTNGQNPEWMHG